MAGHSEDKGFFGNHYVKVYLVLLALLVVSILGPEVGGRMQQEVEIFGRSIGLGVTLTLITAFGIAVVKAWLVIKNFMHLTIERVVPKLFLAASVLLLALFWGGIAPDVQLHEGRMWENVAAKEAIARGIPSPEGYGSEGEYAAGDEHAADAEYAEEGGHADGAGVSYAGLVPTSKPNDNALPGGYNLVHGAFWSVVVLVAVGTNAVAIILSIGLLLLALETLTRVPMVQRIAGPLLERVLRLPGMGRLRGLLPGGQEG